MKSGNGEIFDVDTDAEAEADTEAFSLIFLVDGSTTGGEAVRSGDVLR